jgi:hypothetical protein
LGDERSNWVLVAANDTYSGLRACVLLTRNLVFSVIEIAPEASIAGEVCGARSVWPGTFIGDPESLADLATLMMKILVDLAKLYAITVPIPKSLVLYTWNPRQQVQIGQDHSTRNAGSPRCR